MKKVLITGAASGIGLATAKLFAKQGWFVGRYDVNEQALEATQNAQDFPSSCFHSCDVTDDSSIDIAITHFSEHSDGQMDVLVNCAGVLHCGAFSELSLEQQDQMIDINTKGLAHIAYKAFPLLENTPKATLINICSGSSIHGVPNLAVYSASKFFVNGLTQALQLEWQQHGIRVLSIKPGFVHTKMVDSIPSAMSSTMVVDLTAEDVAKSIYNSLASNRLSYLLPFKINVFAVLIKLLSERLGAKLTQKILSQ